MEITESIALRLRRQGKIQESNIILMKLLASDPHNASLHYQCARGFDSLGEETKAIPYYERAIELGLLDEELENAFVGLGTIYRSHGHFIESKKLFEKAIRKFPGKEQMKVFYAMALYNLQEHAESMSCLIDCLASTTTNQDLLKNYRAITYLGNRLDASSEQIVQLVQDHPLQTEKSTKTIVEKVTEGLKNVGIGFHTGGCEYDEYYRYFNDPDFETRKCALTAFTVMLGNWHARCGIAFMPQHIRKYTGNYAPHEPCHELNNYIEAFVAHHNQIQRDFPVMHEYIIDFLIRIEEDKKISYEQWFPEVDKLLFKQLREEILIPNKSNHQSEVKFFLREAGIPPFFLSDLIE